jgi:hypothetical protein
MVLWDLNDPIAVEADSQMHLCRRTDFRTCREI